MSKNDLFSISCGWLKYRPFRNYELPSLEVVCDEEEEPISAVFEDHRTKKIVFKRKLYRLRWPGQLWNPSDASKIKLPEPLVKSWPPCKSRQTVPVLVSDLLKEGLIPEPAAETLAYHVSVNRKIYSSTGRAEDTLKSVAALPTRCVDEVLDAEFAIDEKTFAALKYLKWHAESHIHHPLFADFDTMIREMLMALSHKSAFLYFKLLKDNLYSRSSKWWVKHCPARVLWPHFACYLHWVGRIGTGLYESVSGLCDNRVKEDIQKEYSDLQQNMENEDMMWQWRAHGHTEGEDGGCLKLSD